MRQKRYYKPKKTLTKSQLKKRREAVKRRVDDSRSRAKQVREIRETSRAVIKTDFSKRGESSRKRKLSEEKNQLKMKQLEHENTILKRKAERLYKRLQREGKVSI